ncbi:MAG: hypothetical protein OXJ90_14165 [Spirochaetaceae bacterium]|nr:hypothetical protein [Spirochaetaceae bacterium]
MRPVEIIFEVTEAPEGGYDAKALGHSIFTQGEDWDDLKTMVRDAVLCHFDEEDVPRVIRLHLVREEAIAV